MLPASLNNFRPFLKIPAFLLQTLDFVEREDGETRRWGEGTRGEGFSIFDPDLLRRCGTSFRIADCGFIFQEERGSDRAMERGSDGTPNTEHQTPNTKHRIKSYHQIYLHIRTATSGLLRCLACRVRMCRRKFMYTL